MPRNAAAALLLLPALLLVSCGGPGRNQSAARTQRALPPVLAKVPAQPALLVPVSSATTLGRQGNAHLKAALTGHGQDTVTLHLTRDGDGQVTVSAGSSTLFQRQHVSGASILQFGRRHLPVLLLQDSFDLCGSGGCATSAYTWSVANQAMLQVAPPVVPAYRYDPARHQFVQTFVAMIGGLFGYIVPGRDGIVLQARTYDPWQHSLSQSYAYAPGLSATGGWIAVGQARYSPVGAESGVAFADPGQALLALLSARSMDFRPQVEQVTDPAASLPDVWQNLRLIGSWQGSLFAILASPEVQTSGQTATASDRVSGLVGQGAEAKLQAYEVTAVLKRIGSNYFVETAHLAPLAVKVQSTLQVLTAIRADRALLQALARAGNPPLQIEAIGQEWQVSLVGQGSMQNQPWIEIDALTGKVHKTG